MLLELVHGADDHFVRQLAGIAHGKTDRRATFHANLIGEVAHRIGHIDSDRSIDFPRIAFAPVSALRFAPAILLRGRSVLSRATPGILESTGKRTLRNEAAAQQYYYQRVLQHVRSLIARRRLVYAQRVRPVPCRRLRHFAHFIAYVDYGT